MRTEWRDGERTRVVEVTPEAHGRYHVVVDGVAHDLGAERLPDGRLRLAGPDGEVVAEITAEGERRFVRLGTLEFVVERMPTGTASRARRSGSAPAGGLEAPMPGLVTRVMVAPGDTVEKGQPLLALEAMKMEHVIRSPRAGRVRRVSARTGEMVKGGISLVELEAEGG
jgi:3-methylcrotonyl-CoA carboxylase alpha subunit